MGVLNQLLISILYLKGSCCSSRCFAPSSTLPWPLLSSCSSRCPLPPAPLQSLQPPCSPSLPPRPPPLPRSPSSASKPSSLDSPCSPRKALAGEATVTGEARGPPRWKRSLPSRLLLTLRLRTATRG